MIIAIIQSINSFARRNISTIIKFKRRGRGEGESMKIEEIHAMIH